MDGYRLLICLVAAILYCSSSPDPLDTLTINLNIDGSQRSTIPPTPPTPPTPTPPPTDYNCTCGIKNPKIDQETTRIVGGNNTGIFEYPWMVSLKKKIYEGKGYKHHCGGVLVASQWVLTAAHCIDQYLDVPHYIFVFLGEHDQTTADETDKTIMFKASKIIKHPEFEIYYQLNYDIGLIKLDGSADLNIYTPVCLSEANQFFTGMKGTVTGWGSNGTFDIYPDQLQFLHATVGSDEYCRAPWDPDNSTMTYTCSTQLGKIGKGECFGDNGGPLTVEFFGRHYLVGLVSGPAPWSFLYCGDGSITTYAAAAKLRNWIDQTIEENGGAAYCTPTPFPFDKDEE